jgi:hypothetical protein
MIAAARPATIATGVARAKARSAVVIPAAMPSAQAVIPGEASHLHLAVVDSLPAAIIILLNADDAKITADSIYIAAAESLTSTIPKLEAARTALDTVLLHQIQPPPDASFWLPASRTIKVGGALLISYALTADGSWLTAVSVLVQLQNRGRGHGSTAGCARTPFCRGTSQAPVSAFFRAFPRVSARFRGCCSVTGAVPWVLFRDWCGSLMTPVARSR